MKKQQQVGGQINPLKKEHEGQLRELIESYFIQVGSDMENVWDVVFSKKDLQKQSTNLNDEKLERKKKLLEWGKVILLSTVGVLLCTMIGIFEYQAILLFGLYWGLVFTKYELNLNHELTEMVVYWMTFSLVIALENILKIGLFFMPFYHSLKLFFIISLLYPPINLKSKILKQYFLPQISVFSQSIQSQKL